MSLCSSIYKEFSFQCLEGRKYCLMTIIIIIQLNVHGLMRNLHLHLDNIQIMQSIIIIILSLVEKLKLNRSFSIKMCSMEHLNVINTSSVKQKKMKKKKFYKLYK